MASIRKRGRHWFVRFRDETGRQREVKCGPDKSVANQIRRDLEVKLCRIKAGVLDPREASVLDADREPVTRHIRDYVAYLTAKGCAPEHVEGVRKRLEWFVDEVKITRLSQIRPSQATLALASFKAGGRAERTCQHLATHMRAFTRWAWKDRRTREDLLADLEHPKVVNEAKRSALTPEQVAKLIGATRTGKIRRGMTGEDRAWLYTLAVYTGLRRSELQALTPESFVLSGTSSIVSLPGRDTKNSSAAAQPLPSYVVPALCVWLVSKPAHTPLFPRDRNSALMIRADLKAAGIGHAEFCFHSLRHTYVTAIVQSGASTRDCMELARHASASLTMGRYAHSRLTDLAQIVDKMPNVLAHALPTPGVSAGYNGTSTNAGEVSPVTPQEDPLGQVDRCGAPVSRRWGCPDRSKSVACMPAVAPREPINRAFRESLHCT